MQYRKDRQGNDISILGFGCMRFVRKGAAIDFDRAEAQLCRAVELGVNYFDTAYLYPGSEELLGAVLAKNGLREQVRIATKLPQYLVRNAAAIDRFFDEELSRLQTDHVDYYLMHMITDVAQWEKLQRLGIEDWIARKKAAGQIGQVGFSFHGATEGFLRVLEAYDWDFCQIQYNYLDEHAQAGRRGLMAAAERGIPVMIMEPLRGGKLVDLLPEEGRRLVADLCAAINARVKVGCTGCGYCMPCPKGVDIPALFRCWNEMYTEGKNEGRKEYWQTVSLRKQKAFARQCVKCGACESHCPQGIAIRELIHVADRELRPLPWRIAGDVARPFMMR